MTDNRRTPRSARPREELRAGVALRSADLVVAPGEVHALLGANGAGKSTLVKLLTGVIRADGGTIAVRGKRAARRLARAGAARSASRPSSRIRRSCPDLTVAQNLRLTRRRPRAPCGAQLRGDGPRRRLHGARRRRAAADAAHDRPRARARARPELLLLDEITAALPSDLAERVFAVMHARRERGRSVLFITHRLNEVIATCDRATILRDGAAVATIVPQEGGEERIVEHMLGPEAAQARRRGDRARRAGRRRLGTRTRPPSLEVESAVDRARARTSRSRCARARSSASPRSRARGRTSCSTRSPASAGRTPARSASAGGRFKARHPYDAIRAGLVLVPADRLHALLPQRSVRENIASPRYNRFSRWGPINMRDEGRRVRNAVEALQIDMRAERQVRRLSGGNQQKVTIARWLASGFATLLCFDPTRGIDVGTKRQIYALLRRLADDGGAILFFSSELAEFPLVCDRVLTLFGGRVTAELPGAAADEATLLRAMHGLVGGEAVA